jgi:uncharacterized LabA/DUF88 family protein
MSVKVKASVFIDGSNIYFAQKKMGKWLDWVKVKKFLKAKYKITSYKYYAGLRQSDQKTKSFLKKLLKIGFTVVSKPVKVVTDEKGNKFEKANFDVEMTADILLNLKNLDLVIIFSGDSDFAYLCELIHKDKKKVHFYASKRTLAWELRKTADKFFYLEDFGELTKGKEFVRI